MLTRKYTFLDFAEEVLKASTQPMTFQEIWSAGDEQGIVRKLSISGKTPWQTLGARLFVDVRDNPNSKFIKVGKNPARFFLSSRKGEIDGRGLDLGDDTRPTKPTRNREFEFRERALHQLIAYFAYTNTSFNRGKQIYTKTIYHEKSAHSTLSEWVYPDMVGFYSPVEDWNEKLLEFSKVTAKPTIRLYSFEIKKRLDRSNYREYFFQAVSNSSWANEGYLVTCYVQQRDDLLSELERLSASFGIGIIHLDLEDIDSSHVLFPARLRDNLDWELMNKLCEQSKDFSRFIDDVQRDYAVRKIHPSEYEPILKDPEKYVLRIRSGKE